jgi:hypothetical protein
MSLAVRKPAKKASYSAVLFVTGKDKAREISTTIPLLISTIIPAPLPLELDYPSTKTDHSSELSSGGECESYLFNPLVPCFRSQQCFASEIYRFLSLCRFSDEEGAYRVRGNGEVQI